MLHMEAMEEMVVIPEAAEDMEGMGEIADQEMEDKVVKAAMVVLAEATGAMEEIVSENSSSKNSTYFDNSIYDRNVNESLWRRRWSWR